MGRQLRPTPGAELATTGRLGSAAADAGHARRATDADCVMTAVERRHGDTADPRRGLPQPLNGPSDLFATPCADGDYAFGKTGQCGGNVVKYYTVTMTDMEQRHQLPGPVRVRVRLAHRHAMAA